MRVSEAFRLAIELGKANDPRPPAEVARALEAEREAFDALPEAGRELFDRERLWNPYADCRISWAAGDPEAERMLWGIDVGIGEVLLADRLRERGEEVSAVVGHHPFGLSRARFPEVVRLQADMAAGWGVPAPAAEALARAREEEALLAAMPSNYNRAADAARLLGIPVMNVHSAADNCAQRFMEREFDEHSAYRVGDILDHLLEIPEFRIAAGHNNPPRAIAGGRDSRAGRVVFKMTGGTSWSKEIYARLSQAGVGTVVGMHFPESHAEEAAKAHVNLVVSGHMASDSLGVNAVADMWEREGIETVPCSGLIRVSRNRCSGASRPWSGTAPS